MAFDGAINDQPHFLLQHFQPFFHIPLSLSAAREANRTNLGHNFLYHCVTLKLTSSSTYVLLLSKIHPLFASLVHLFKMYILGIVFISRKSKTFET